MPDYSWPAPLISALKKLSLLRTVEVQNGRPLSLALGPPGNRAIENPRDYRRRKVMMETEETHVKDFVSAPKAERQMRRIIFR